ncbi:hypothetical protein E4O03_10945 [Treponema sp. OMZ 792]|uniref:hypothetical protein n=1 Tax=unclassified Treponema TaxID=2638727 RepID=UPI0020A5E515|nr:MULTISPECIES: hypothetical protein [unclassified Treponema]UTC74704.1 hypothetical protein E4O03_10945 [Treponema sp. OMZ 792]UTC76972.1 hypothetical protein E4O04_02665 [Treponema sp. OMZ 799]UTC81098.1 hypothetical protein E4O07_10845 [Treponema sp. OMZ 798]
MNKIISERIAKLGGKCAFETGNLLSNMRSISFTKSFLMKDFSDYLEDDLLHRIKEEGIIPEEEIPYPRIQYKTEIFTPFTKGTASYDEYSTFIDKDYVSSVIPCSELEFLIIGDSNSYPNYYFICLSDNDFSNPKVYTTDHEVYFREIEEFGRFSDFLDLFLLDEEYKEEMKRLIE